jgi:O-acetyl-ADP-ribose deacetylase (regulator of RNase III)
MSSGVVPPRIAVVQGSLTDGQETVLVNASNTNAALGSGVSGAIRRACGPGYQEHITKALHSRFGEAMEPGDVLITDAGAHPTAKWVAHVAVMDYRKGFTGNSFPTLEVIERGCTKLWPAVEDLGEDVTVAMVALGAGTGQLGVREPTRIACETFLEHLSVSRTKPFPPKPSSKPSSHITGITFYGFMFYEHMAMADVVKTSFPEMAS